MTSAIVDGGQVTVAGAWFEFGIVPVLEQRRRCWWPVSSRGADATAPGVIHQCAATGADTRKRNRGRQGRYERREDNAGLAFSAPQQACRTTRTLHGQRLARCQPCV